MPSLISDIKLGLGRQKYIYYCANLLFFGFTGLNPCMRLFILFIIPCLYQNITKNIPTNVISIYLFYFSSPYKAVRDFDEKTRQDKPKKPYFETMKRFLGLKKYLKMKMPLLYYNHLTYSYTITNYHAAVRQLK